MGEIFVVVEVKTGSSRIFCFSGLALHFKVNVLTLEGMGVGVGGWDGCLDLGRK